MVACLFARSAYSAEQLGACLAAAGYETLAETIPETAEYIRTLRWNVRIDSGFKPEELTIPQRFYKVETWKGKIDRGYLDALKSEYGKRIMALVEHFEP